MSSAASEQGNQNYKELAPEKMHVNPSEVNVYSRKFLQR